MSVGNFRLRSLALTHSLGNFRFGSFAWNLQCRVGFQTSYLIWRAPAATDTRIYVGRPPRPEHPTFKVALRRPFLFVVQNESYLTTNKHRARRLTQNVGVREPPPRKSAGIWGLAGPPELNATFKIATLPFHVRSKNNQIIIAEMGHGPWAMATAHWHGT